MEKLSKTQLQELVVILENELYTYNRNINIHGVYNENCKTVRDILQVVRNELSCR